MSFHASAHSSVKGLGFRAGMGIESTVLLRVPIRVLGFRGLGFRGHYKFCNLEGPYRPPILELGP